MASKRLNLTPKSLKKSKKGKSKKSKKSQKRGKVKSKSNIKFRSTPRTVILVMLGFSLLSLLGFALYYYRSDFLVLVPGYYQNAIYDRLTTRKNDLIDENSELLKEKDDLETSLAEFGQTVEDYDNKIDTYELINTKLSKVNDNFKDILGYDTEILELRLPIHVREYVDVSTEVDNTRWDVVKLSIRITDARILLAQFNRKLVEYDSCLDDAMGLRTDEEVANALSKCNLQIQGITDSVDKMESDYGVELDVLKKYVTLLGEEWTAAEKYREALAQKDHATANTHSDTMSEKKRERTELGEAIAMNQFSELVIQPMVDELVDKIGIAEEKESEADEIYDEYLKR